MTIPVLDLSHFTKGTSAEKTTFVQDLGNTFETIGFVSIKNHEISQSLINNLYLVVQEFFALSPAEKESYEIPGLAGQRGYTSFGKEHAKGSTSADLKEFFQFGQFVMDMDDTTYPENVQVVDNELFNSSFLDIYRSFEKAGTSLLQAIALYLHLDEFYFDEHVFEGNSILRAIHYPPITSEPKSSLRAEQHEDINLITLLVGASSEGLEVMSKNNEWIPVKAGEGEIVVNVGDMLQRLTNDKLKSTTHRVVNPPREKWNTSRFSIPFFLHPKSKMSLACLTSCVSETNLKKYADYTAGQYLDERLKEIGLKK
jgi:isopenicillin N synthase-like dioxygenase